MLLEIIDKDGYQQCLVSGPFVMETALAEVPKILEAVIQKQQARVLIDYRQLDGTLAATERFIFASYMLDLYEDHLAKGGLKVRVVFLGGQQMNTDFNPGLDHATSRGLTANVVTDRVPGCCHKTNSKDYQGTGETVS